MMTPNEENTHSRLTQWNWMANFVKSAISSIIRWKTSINVNKGLFSDYKWFVSIGDIIFSFLSFASSFFVLLSSFFLSFGLCAHKLSHSVGFFMSWTIDIEANERKSNKKCENASYLSVCVSLQTGFEKEANRVKEQKDKHDSKINSIDCIENINQNYCKSWRIETLWPVLGSLVGNVKASHRSWPGASYRLPSVSFSIYHLTQCWIILDRPRRAESRWDARIRLRLAFMRESIMKIGWLLSTSHTRISNRHEFQLEASAFNPQNVVINSMAKAISRVLVSKLAPAWMMPFHLESIAAI